MSNAILPDASGFAATAPAPSPDDRLESALQLFCRALDEVNRLERRPVCSAIEYVMRQSQPGLELPDCGGADSEALAALAAQRGLVRLTVVNGEVLVQRRWTANESGAAETARASEPAPALYREFLEGKLKCLLPAAPVRRRVFEETAAVLAGRIRTGGPISLMDLSFRVEGRMEGAAGQRVVFKLLFALVLASAFEIACSQRLHAIAVLAPAAPVERWDELFIGACLAGLRRDQPGCAVNPEALASVFDVAPETMRQLLSTRQRAALRPPRMASTPSDLGAFARPDRMRCSRIVNPSRPATATW